VIPKWGLLALAALFAISISPAYAQHHSGSLAPPVDFDGLKVAISTILSPEGFIFEDTNNANLAVRFFDSETNVNIQSVTYRIQIFHNDTLVANEYFFDEDGKLDVKIKPTTGCQEQELWKCTKYYGEKHAIAGAYYARGDSLPTIQGPVFDRSGQYNVKVSIVGATNPRTMTTTDLLFETFLHIPQKEIFLIKTANAQEIPISIKSYNGEISNFSYDESSKKISYDIHHDDQSSQKHASGGKQIISIQDGFSDFKHGYDIDVFANGIQLQDNSFNIDGSIPGENIIRINIPHEEFISITDKQNNESHKDIMKIEVLSGEEIEFDKLDFTFENDFTANVLWDSKSKAGKEIPFTFSFFDKINKPTRDILFAYSIVDNSGEEIWSNIGTTNTYLGILAPHGIAQESIFIPNDGEYQMKLILTGQNSVNYQSFLVSDSSFNFSSQNEIIKEKDIKVPVWIKNNAGWWAENAINDDSFVQGIQFLIKEGFMRVPISEQSSASQDNKIPDWIKNNAGWWADDLISDDDFVKGIQFLISQGYITIN